MLFIKIKGGEVFCGLLANDGPDQFVDFLAYAELDAPTQTVNFAKPLPKGHYAVVCFLPVGGGEDGPPHLMEGMITDFTVG